MKRDVEKKIIRSVRCAPTTDFLSLLRVKHLGCQSFYKFQKFCEAFKGFFDTMPFSRALIIFMLHVCFLCCARFFFQLNTTILFAASLFFELLRKVLTSYERCCSEKTTQYWHSTTKVMSLSWCLFWYREILKQVC